MAGVGGGDSWAYANPMPGCVQIQYPSLCGLGIISQAGKNSLPPCHSRGQNYFPCPPFPSHSEGADAEPSSLSEFSGGVESTAIFSLNKHLWATCLGLGSISDKIAQSLF